MTKKLIITSGCSLSECIDFKENWPVQLCRLTGTEGRHMGLGSQGNGLISRKAIWAVENALKEGYAAQDIAVIIMWSGLDRHDFFGNGYETPRYRDLYERKFAAACMENPHNFANPIARENEGWIILGACHGDDPIGANYYKNFYSFIGHEVITLEHVTRTQWYLDKLGIDYAMMAYMTCVFEMHTDHPDVGWLHNMVDWSKFITMEGYFDYVRPRCDDSFFHEDKWHPNAKGAEVWVRDMVWPYVQNRKWIAP